MPAGAIGLQVAIILLLILANGVFAMSEIAVVSARKARLQARADGGDAGARRALELTTHPNRFLATVQIGITLIGIFAGAYGGATLADAAGPWLASTFPAIARYSDAIALGSVVAAITFLSLVVGELVPKRIGLTNPERIAALVARPMHAMSVVATPLVRVLSVSTDALLRLLRVRRGTEPPVTDAEIAALLEAGTKAGVFEEQEQDLVARVFWLADQRADALLTPRHRIAWLDVGAREEVVRRTLVEHRHARYLVCDGSLDRVLGMVHVSDVLARTLENRSLDLRALLRTPLFVPGTIKALRLMEMFRATGVHLAVIVDEYGGTDGLVTLNDLLEHLYEEIGPAGETGITRRADGTWLIDAALAMDEVREALDVDERPPQETYRTLGGFLVERLGHLPAVGDHIVAFRHRFEVVDMDGLRVDQVMVTPEAPDAAESAAGEPVD